MAAGEILRINAPELADAAPVLTHVALAHVDALPAAVSMASPDWLSAPELQRYRAMAQASRQRQFLAARWWVRVTLARVAGGAWQDYALSAQEGAAPCLLGAPAARWHLSLSHSRAWVACAVSSAPVGVDIEDATVPRDAQALAESVCSAQERGRLFASGGDVDLGRVLSLWTLKEAGYKQRQGKQSSLREVQFAPGAAATAPGAVFRSSQFVLAVVGSAAQSLDWHLPEVPGLQPPTYWRGLPDAALLTAAG